MGESITSLIMPSNFITLLFLVAATLFYLKHHKASIIALGSAITLYMVLGFGPVAHFLLGQLEYSYSPYQKCHTEGCDITAIVVLTGDGEKKADIPVTSYVNSSSMFRLVEASRILQLHPDAKIYISGSLDVARMMKQVLLSMNIARQSIEVDKQANNTYQSAINLRPSLMNRKFALVTSAGHMPRSMAVFNYQQLQAVAAPTEFLSQRNILAAQYLPTARHLLYSELAIHEYLAIAWYRLSGRI